MPSDSRFWGGYGPAGGASGVVEGSAAGLPLADGLGLGVADLRILIAVIILSISSRATRKSVRAEWRLEAYTVRAV